MSGPRDGLRVIELATVLAGPSVGQFLAELGADVLKIEPPHGDVTRRWTLAEEDPATSRPAYFASVNWGKRAATLDLREDDGRAELHRLAAEADIVLTSFRPGTDAALGADAETLRALNPRLIVARLVGYADDNRPGYDAVIQAESGLTGMNGEADGLPTKLPVALVDVLAAHQLKEAILVALLRRERTGEGATITVSLFGAAVASLANQASGYLTAGVVPRRMGSDHPSIAPYGTVFRTADGKALVLAVGTDAQFRALCDVLGLDRLADAPTFATNAKRVRNRTFLHSMLTDAIASRQRDELLRALEKGNVPAGAVRDLAEVFATPEANKLVVRDEATGLAAVRTAAFTMDGVEPVALAPPPESSGTT